MRVLFALLLFPLLSVAGEFAPVPEPQNQFQTQAQSQGQSQTQTNGQTNAGNHLHANAGDYYALPSTPAAYAPTVINRTNCYYTPKSSGWSLPFFSVSSAKTKRDEECRLHQVAEDIHPLSPALSLQLHCKDPIILAGIADGSIDPKLCVFSPPAVVTVTKDYVDRVVESAKEEAKTRTDTAFRQSQSK